MANPSKEVLEAIDKELLRTAPDGPVVGVDPLFLPDYESPGWKAAADDADSRSEEK